MTTVALGEIASWGSGGTPSRSVREYFGHGLPWLSIADLNDGLVQDAKESLTPLGIEHSSAKPVPPGALLVAMYGSIGKLGIAARELCTSQAIAFAIPDARRVDTRYLFHFLLSERPRLQSRGRGGTQSNIGQGDLKAWQMPLPALPEQRRIAAILDAADALRAKRRAAIRKLDELTQSIFLDMFGDPATNPKGWPRVMLADVCRDANDIKCGPFGTQLSQSEYMAAGVPLWGIRHVNASFAVTTNEFLAANTAERLAAYSIVPGDIVMTRKGTVGNCAVYPRGMPLGIMHSDLLRLRVDGEKCDPTFVAHQLHTSRDVDRQIVAISGGAVMPGINVTKLKGLEIVLPPIREQRFFQAGTAAIAEHRSKTSRSCDLLNALFASLQHRAFRGEL